MMRTFSSTRLQDAVSGRVITPDDADYDKTRTVFYGGIDRRPAAIVRVADARDVAGGIVLDLRGMKGLEIDPGNRTPWAEGGVTAGEYTLAAAAHGLATGFGDTASVGIAGLTLGGGVGYLSRKCRCAGHARRAPGTMRRPGTRNVERGDS